VSTITSPEDEKEAEDLLIFVKRQQRDCLYCRVKHNGSLFEGSQIQVEVYHSLNTCPHVFRISRDTSGIVLCQCLFCRSPELSNLQFCVSSQVFTPTLQLLANHKWITEHVLVFLRATGENIDESLFTSWVDGKGILYARECENMWKIMNAFRLWIEG